MIRLPDHSEEMLRSLDFKISTLRSHWLKCLEYYGPLSAEQTKRFRVLRWYFARQLSDEAVRRWGITRLDGDIVAEAAISSLNGVLRCLARLTSLEDLVEEEMS